MFDTSAIARYQAPRRFIGTVTPSGNTVVERVTLGILHELSALPEVSAHFSRTPVFGSVDPSPDAYATAGLLAAAELLAHARPDVLVWNGSKGAGIGLAHDRALADAMTAHTGIRATTSMLGLDALMKARGHTRVAVVTPYTTAGHARTLAGLHAEGYEVVADACAGRADNLAHAGMPLEQIAQMVRTVAAARPQVVLTLCTNMPGAVLAAPLEAELGLPVWDSTAFGVWHALSILGVDARAAAAAWGSLFTQRL